MYCKHQRFSDQSQPLLIVTLEPLIPCFNNFLSFKNDLQTMLKGHFCFSHLVMKFIMGPPVLRLRSMVVKSQCQIKLSVSLIQLTFLPFSDLVGQDFLVTVVLVIFWFTSSIAWAAGLSGLKKATNQDSVFNNYAACTADYKAITKCDAFEGATYGSATVSVVSKTQQV